MIKQYKNKVETLWQYEKDVEIKLFDANFSKINKKRNTYFVYLIYSSDGNNAILSTEIWINCLQVIISYTT